MEITSLRYMKNTRRTRAAHGRACASSLVQARRQSHYSTPYLNLFCLSLFFPYPRVHLISTPSLSTRVRVWNCCRRASVTLLAHYLLVILSPPLFLGRPHNPVDFILVTPGRATNNKIDITRPDSPAIRSSALP